MKAQRNQYNEITDMLARLVADKRIKYGFSPSLDADHIGVNVYFSGGYICTLNAAADHSNMMQCIRDLFEAHPARQLPTYYVTTNTLGKRAVYSIAVIAHSNHEDATRLKTRCSAALVAAIEAADVETLCLINTHCDAYMSAGRYNMTNVYAFEKP